MKYLFRRFQPAYDSIYSPFDCGISDLNEFLLSTSSSTSNATLYEKERLAVTYVVEDNDSHQLLAYFSLLHDKIERDFADSRIWNQLSRKIPNAKRRSSYPAIKIGRLAVNRQVQGAGIGGYILDFIKAWYYEAPKAGCRFITVDALKTAEAFYTKCQFKPLTETDANNETILMYYDIMGIV